MSDTDIGKPHANSRLFYSWWSRSFFVLMAAFALIMPHMLSVKLYADPVFWLFVVVVSAGLSLLLAGFRAFVVEPAPFNRASQPAAKAIPITLQISMDQTGIVQLKILPPADAGAALILPEGKGAKP